MNQDHEHNDPLPSASTTSLDQTKFNITQYSDEILVKIIGHLNHIEDIVNLSQTCTRFDRLIEDKCFVSNIRFPWSTNNIHRADLTKFLIQPNRAFNITVLDLSDLYWVPSGVIRSFTIKLVNLQGFYAAGTQLSWTHLVQILHSLSQLKNLSWSWDTRLEDAVLTSTSRNGAMAEIQGLKNELERIQFLFIHIPLLQKSTIQFTSHSSLSYLISLCVNLENLWIMSYPKTPMEVKLTNTALQNENLDIGKTVFKKLKSCIINVVESHRIYTPKLYTAILKSLQENQDKNRGFIENLWLNHPLFDIYFLKNSKDPTESYNLDFQSLDTLSIPLTPKTIAYIKNQKFSKLKKLRIYSGLSYKVSLNGIFDTATNLESFCSRACNFRLDWTQFIKAHPNLIEVNVCEDESLQFPDYCIALSSLQNLTRLSLPISALFEIRNPEIISEYRIKANLIDTNEEEKQDQATSEGISFKKRRIGVSLPSKEDTNSITGLDLLTLNCPCIEEFELGFCNISSRYNMTGGGLILANSLFNIKRWKKLKNLTLHNIPITNGKFLPEITKSCTNLQVLRLSSLGAKGKCSYILDLISSLKYCSILKDFRLEQTYIGSTIGLLEALGHIKSLERLLIWSSPNDSALDPSSTNKLLLDCDKLKFLYLTIGSTTLQSCKKIRNSLEEKYKSSRPPLTILIRNSLEESSSNANLLHYPSIHYREMIYSGPLIAQYTDFPTPPI